MTILRPIKKNKGLGKGFSVERWMRQRNRKRVFLGIVGCLFLAFSIIVLVGVLVAISGQYRGDKVGVHPMPVPRLASAGQVWSQDMCGLTDVLCDYEQVDQGKASWLVYQRPDTCASRDWPKGTRLYVQLADDPMIGTDCVVRDFGPDKSVFPDRIVDLSRQMFERLAPASTGVVKVVVSPKKI